MGISRFYPSFQRRLIYVVFVVLALACTLQLLQTALPNYLPMDWSQAHEMDGIVDWKAARLGLAGKSPYTPEGLKVIGAEGFGHPPTTPFWFLPLANFSKAITAEIVGLMVWFGLVIHLFITAKELKFPAPVILTGLLGAMVLSTSWLKAHYVAVQFSEHIAFAYVVGWYYLRRRKDVPAGIAIGIAASLKLFPGLIMLFFLVSGRWKAFIASSLTFLGIAAVMTKVFGFESWILFFKQQGPVGMAWIGHVRNASIHGIISRIGTPICTGESLPTGSTTGVAIGISLVILIAAFWLCRSTKRLTARDPSAIDLPFALFSLLSVFLNAWAWEHYYVLLLQPLLIIAATFYSYSSGAFRRWSNEETSHLQGLRQLSVGLGGFAALLAIVKMLSFNIWTKQFVLDYWIQTQNEWYHTHLHMMEVANWLPWVIAILLCAFCIFLNRPAQTPEPVS